MTVALGQFCRHCGDCFSGVFFLNSERQVLCINVRQPNKLLYCSHPGPRNNKCRDNKENSLSIFSKLTFVFLTKINWLNTILSYRYQGITFTKLCRSYLSQLCHNKDTKKKLIHEILWTWPQNLEKDKQVCSRTVYTIFDMQAFCPSQIYKFFFSLLKQLHMIIIRNHAFQNSR